MLSFLELLIKTVSSFVFLFLCAFFVYVLSGKKAGGRKFDKTLKKFLNLSSTISPGTASSSMQVSSTTSKVVRQPTSLEQMNTFRTLISKSVRCEIQKQLCFMLSFREPSPNRKTTDDESFIPINREKSRFSGFELPTHQKYLSLLSEKVFVSVRTDLGGKWNNQKEKELVHQIVEKVVPSLVKGIFSPALASGIQMIEGGCSSVVSQLFWTLLWDCYNVAISDFLEESVDYLVDGALNSVDTSQYDLDDFMEGLVIESVYKVLGRTFPDTAYLLRKELQKGWNREDLVPNEITRKGRRARTGAIKSSGESVPWDEYRFEDEPESPQSILDSTGRKMEGKRYHDRDLDVERLEHLNLAEALNQEIGVRIGGWFAEILKMDDEDRVPLIAFFDRCMNLSMASKGNLIESEDVAESLAHHIKRIFRDEVLRDLKGAPFFETLDAIGNQLVTGGGNGENHEYSLEGLPPALGAGINSTQKEVDTFDQKNELILETFDKILGKLKKSKAEIGKKDKTGKLSAEQNRKKEKKLEDDLKETLTECEMTLKLLSQLDQTSTATNSIFLPKREQSVSETVRLDAHRLKGEHYELLEQNLPKVITGLKTARMLAQVLAGSSEGESSLIWVVAKVMQNKHLKELKSEIIDVENSLELVMNALVIFRVTALVVLESCAEHLPNLVKGVTGLAEFAIDAYILEGIRAMAGYEEKKAEESSLHPPRSRSPLPSPSLGVRRGERGRERGEKRGGRERRGSVSKRGAVAFTDMLLNRMSKSFLKKIFKSIGKRSSFRIDESRVFSSLRRALLKDILAVGFSKLKDFHPSEIEKEISQMAPSREQGERLAKFMSIFSGALSKTIDVVVEKVDSNKDAWNRKDFIPEIISECVTFFAFSDLSNVGLKWSDFLLEFKSQPQFENRHFGVLYQFLQATNTTLEKVMKEIGKETKGSAFVNLNGVIPMDPIMIANYLTDISQKCRSASKVINALRYKNSTRAAVTMRIALNDDDERVYVSEQIDMGVTTLVKVSENLGLDMKYLGDAARKVVGNLKDIDTFRGAIQEFGMEIVSFVTIRKSLPEEATHDEVEKQLEALGLHESFLQMVTIISGARSAATWYGFGRQLFRILTLKGREIVTSALSFLIPGTYLMVGRGAKLVKPTTVRRMGAKMLIGSLFDVQNKNQRYHYEIPGNIEAYVESIRAINQRILNLGGKVYAGESAYRHMGDREKERDSRVSASRISLLNSEEIKVINEELPRLIEKQVPIGKLTSDLDSAKKRVIHLHSQHGGKRETWGDDLAFMKLLEPAYHQVFLLNGLLVMRKEELDVRLAELKKVVSMDGKLSKRTMDEFTTHFSEENLFA